MVDARNTSSLWLYLLRVKWRGAMAPSGGDGCVNAGGKRAGGTYAWMNGCKVPQPLYETFSTWVRVSLPYCIVTSAGDQRNYSFVSFKLVYVRSHIILLFTLLYYSLYSWLLSHEYLKLVLLTCFLLKRRRKQHLCYSSSVSYKGQMWTVEGRMSCRHFLCTDTFLFFIHWVCAQASCQITLTMS